MSLLVIRADADADTGSGHFMRTLALAEAWSASGGHALFVSHCTSAALRAGAERKGFEIIPLSGRPGSAADLDQAVSVLRDAGDQASCLCLDGYGFQPHYQQRARSVGVPMLVIDDTAHQPEYRTDLLLNQNIGADRLQYHVDADTEKLLGPRYALLRREFLERRPSGGSSPAVCQVLVTFGGSDPANLTCRVVRAIAGVPDIQLTVLVGSMNQNTEQLNRLAASARARVRLIRGSNNIAEHMGAADLALSASGSTCWELCFLGVPALLVVAAENQHGIAEGLERAGAAVNLGWHADLTANSVREAVETWASAPERRVAMGAAARALVDGKGAARVAAALARRLR
jgi:UDP-2,4-diacetamido-2,4,6-trideoxy-beta-L-altropyranose hydrolase